MAKQHGHIEKNYSNPILEDLEKRQRQWKWPLHAYADIAFKNSKNYFKNKSQKIDWPFLTMLQGFHIKESPFLAWFFNQIITDLPETKRRKTQGSLHDIQ